MSDLRALRRRLGPVAWCVLEDLVEDAAVDSLGRRVAASSVRRLAENLGVSKDTTARALRRLTSAQLIAALPAPRADRGRFGGGAYLICVASPQQHSAGPSTAPALRRPRVRSTAVSQPSLFDAPADDGVPAGAGALKRAETRVRTAEAPGRGAAEAGEQRGRREAAGCRSDGRGAAPERSAAG